MSSAAVAGRARRATRHGAAVGDGVTIGILFASIAARGDALAALAVAGLGLFAAIVFAASSRRAPRPAHRMLDLAVVAVATVLTLPPAGGGEQVLTLEGHGHVGGAAPVPLLAAVITVWGIARLVLLRRDAGERTSQGLLLAVTAMCLAVVLLGAG